ncbi:MAG: hypothetical protein NT074_07425 [Methanomicrobiales archaeon]|nr:hypothetical protein [Methanomicrobiales archaeon]
MLEPTNPPAREPGGGNAIPKVAILGVSAVVIIAIIAAVLLVPHAPTVPPSPPVTTSPAVTPNTPPSPEKMALVASDFPAGFSILYAGETAPDENCTEKNFCTTGGYSVSAGNTSGTSADGMLLDQTILIYTQPATKERLSTVFDASYPELSSWGITPLPDPQISDMCLAWRFAVPQAAMPGNATLGGYALTFGKGGVYEIFVAIGTQSDYTLVKDLAGKAAARVTT